VSVGGVVRHSDSQTAEFLVIVEPKNLGWQAGDDGRDTAELVLAAASLNGRRDILASKMQTWNVAETAFAEADANRARGDRDTGGRADGYGGGGAENDRHCAGSADSAAVTESAAGECRRSGGAGEAAGRGD
jgi:hypothetical protein